MVVAVALEEDCRAPLRGETMGWGELTVKMLALILAISDISRSLGGK
jgi:hypothetical protein